MPVIETTTPEKAAGLSNAVIKYFSCFESADRDTIEDLLTPNFTFTSPKDNRIDRVAYFAKFWPAGIQSQPVFHIKKIFENVTSVFLMYVCKPKNAAPFKNVEIIQFEAGRIKDVQVYFADYTGHE